MISALVRHMLFKDSTMLNCVLFSSCKKKKHTFPISEVVGSRGEEGYQC